MGWIDGRVHQMRDGFVVASEHCGRAGDIEQPWLTVNDRSSNGARQPARTISNLLFPPLGKFRPAAQQDQLSCVALAIENCRQRMLAKLALRRVECGNKDSGR